MYDDNVTYLSLGTAALKLRMSYQRVLTRVQNGELEGIRINGRWRVLRESVERYAERQNGTKATA